MTNPNQIAIDAAKIAIELHEPVGEIVLRAADYEDWRASLAAALDARKIEGINYLEITADAVWDVHGAHLVETPAFSEDDAFLTSVTTVRSKFEFTRGAQINVVGGIDDELLRAAEDAEVYIAQRIFILERTN